MMRGLVLASALLATACLSSPTPVPPAPARAWTLSDELSIEELRPGVWIHTTWRVFASGTRFPSHGLLYEHEGRLYLIDTAWGAEPTVALLDWVQEELGRKVEAAVVTHFHDDRMGGSAVLAEREIPFFAHQLTRQLAEEGTALPESLGNLEPGATSMMGPLEVFYPGAGHSRDNLAVWLPREQILFGGCAVRPLNSQSLGNTADADLTSWPQAIRRLQQSYPNAKIIVPSHGPRGGVELLAHTLGLLEPP